MAADRPPRIHSEHLADTIETHTLCEEPRAPGVAVMGARQFAFGIKHPAVADRLCSDCVEAFRRFVDRY